MKILHIISSLSGGGRERRMAELTKSLNSEGYEVSVALVSPNARQDYALPSSINVTGCGGIASRKQFHKNLNAEIERFQPDVVHLWSEVPTVLLSVLLLKWKYKFKLVTGFLADGNPVKKMTCKLANKGIFAVSEAIVSNSKAGLIAKKAPTNKSHVIYNGFDFKRFKTVPFDADSLIDELGIRGKRVAAMFARFSAAKDWDMFLEIAQIAKRNGRNDIVFLAVGAGDLLNDFKSRAKNLGLNNVRFLGLRKDVENLLTLTNVSLLFSNNHVHAEGVSNSIMESMAAAVPVIATDGGGTPEIIEDGKSGFIIQPSDAQAAYDKLILCMDNNNLRQELGNRSRDIVKNKFSLSKMTNEYIQLYNKILEF